MLLFGFIVAAIGSLCAAIFRWPAMLCVGCILSFAAFVVFVETGFTLLLALLYSILSLCVLEVFYVLAGFVASFSVRKFSRHKKDVHAA